MIDCKKIRLKYFVAKQNKLTYDKSMLSFIKRGILLLLILFLVSCANDSINENESAVKSLDSKFISLEIKVEERDKESCNIYVSLVTSKDITDTVGIWLEIGAIPKGCYFANQYKYTFYDSKKNLKHISFSIDKLEIDESTKNILKNEKIYESLLSISSIPYLYKKNINY